MELMFLGLGGQEIIIIALLVLVFFGGKKIPELMKGLGGGVRSFKDALDGKTDNNKDCSNSNVANKDDKASDHSLKNE